MGSRMVPITSEFETEVFELEFEDREEWTTEYYGTFKSQFRLLAQTIAEQYTVLTAQTLSQYLESLIQKDRDMSANFSQLNAQEQALKPTFLEFKTLLLEFDMLHYVYSPLLLSLVTDNAAKKTVAEAGKEQGMQPLSAADVQAVQSITVNTLNVILQWAPVDPIMQLEQYKILQYHFPLFKLSSDHLGAAFTKLFTALNGPVVASSDAFIAAQQGQSALKEANMEHNSRVASVIASLTQSCAVEIVHTGFFNQFFEQVKIVYAHACFDKPQNAILSPV